MVTVEFVVLLIDSAFWLHIHSLSIYYHSWEYDIEKSFSKW